MPPPQMKSLMLDGNPNYCSLCNLEFSSDDTARTHYQGEHHAVNVRKRDAAPVHHDRNFGIGLGFSSEVGSKRKSDGESDHTSTPKVAKTTTDPSPNSRTYCARCKEDCKTRDGYKVHMMSTAHAAKVAMAPSASQTNTLQIQREGGIMRKGKYTVLSVEKMGARIKKTWFRSNVPAATIFRK